jgi:hypothetical protein
MTPPDLTDDELRDQLHARIDRDAQHYPPDMKAIEAHERIRAATAALAHEYVDLCPPGRELSLALTKLIDEAMSHANAAVARNHARL